MHATDVKYFIRYTNGDVYEGHFKDGVAHGHGLQKQGHFMASVASVYIGEWVNGVKQGYGVMDDIVTGMLLLNKICVDLMYSYLSYPFEIFIIQFENFSHPVYFPNQDIQNKSFFLFNICSYIGLKSGLLLGGENIN